MFNPMGRQFQKPMAGSAYGAYGAGGQPNALAGLAQYQQMDKSAMMPGYGTQQPPQQYGMQQPMDPMMQYQQQQQAMGGFGMGQMGPTMTKGAMPPNPYGKPTTGPMPMPGNPYGPPTPMPGAVPQQNALQDWRMQRGQPSWRY